MEDKTCRLRATLRCALATAALMLMLMPSARAQQRTFDIPASNAAAALPEYARQAGIQIVAPGERLAGIPTSAINGSMDAHAALQMLLSGTGLEVVADDGHTITLGRATPATPQSTSPEAGEGAQGPIIKTDPSAQDGQSKNGLKEQDATQLAPVVVTAQKREQDLQDVPISITVMNSETLRDHGVTNLEGVIDATPSMTFTPYPTSSDTFTIFMRGAGTQDVGQITLDTAIGLYQDGFNIARAQMVNFDLADIERVEVLRGPQGTLYGRNTTGGAVNFISKKPSGEFGFKQEVGFGSSGRFRSLSVLDLPRWAGLSAKLSFLKREKDGYVKNLGSSHNFADENQTAGRVALRWNTGGPFTADYFYERGRSDSTPYYYTNSGLVGLIPGYSDLHRPEHHTYRAINLPESPGKVESQGLTLAWKVNDALTLKSLTGYRNLRVAQTQDYAEAFFVGFRSLDDIRSRQLSQELQALGSAFDGRIEYVAGLYYFKEPGQHTQNIVMTNVLPGSDPLLLNKYRNVTVESESQAAYGQLSWIPPVLNDRLELTLGGRLTRDKRAAERQLLNTFFGFPIAQEPAPGIVNSNNVKSSRFNPAFTANFAWTLDVNVYARVATGYKAGGSSESAPPGQFGITFKPEEVTAYELGFKSYLLDRQLRLNAAAFISKYKDMQLSPNTDPRDLSTVLWMNAGKATIKGLELEALWQPIDTLNFSFQYAYLDPKYNEVLALAGTTFDPAVNSASPYVVGEDIKQLFSFSSAPKNAFNLSSSWTFLKRGTSELTAIASYRWEDRFVNNSGAGPGVPGYEITLHPRVGLLDGRLSWKTELANKSSLRVDFWGKNLTDKSWPLFVVVSGSPVPTRDPVNDAVTPAGFSTSVPIVWAERRSYGVSLAYEF